MLFIVIHLHSLLFIMSFTYITTEESLADKRSVSINYVPDKKTYKYIISSRYEEVCGSETPHVEYADQVKVKETKEMIDLVTNIFFPDKPMLMILSILLYSLCIWLLLIPFIVLGSLYLKLDWIENSNYLCIKQRKFPLNQDELKLFEDFKEKCESS